MKLRTTSLSLILVHRMNLPDIVLQSANIRILQQWQLHCGLQPAQYLITTYNVSQFERIELDY